MLYSSTIPSVGAMVHSTCPATARLSWFLNTSAAYVAIPEPPFTRCTATQHTTYRYKNCPHSPRSTWPSKVVVGELLRRWMPVFEGVRCDVQVTLRANSITVQSGSDQGSSQARPLILAHPRETPTCHPPKRGRIPPVARAIEASHAACMPDTYSYEKVPGSDYRVRLVLYPETKKMPHL